MFLNDFWGPLKNNFIYFSEPLVDKILLMPHSKKRIKKILMRYFELMKIETEHQVPFRSDLERLRLEEVTDMLEKEGFVEHEDMFEEVKEKCQVIYFRTLNSTKRNQL